MLVARIVTAFPFAPLLTVSSPLWSMEAYAEPLVTLQITPRCVVSDGVYSTLYCALLPALPTVESPETESPVRATASPAVLTVTPAATASQASTIDCPRLDASMEATSTACVPSAVLDSKKVMVPLEEPMMTSLRLATPAASTVHPLAGAAPSKSELTRASPRLCNSSLTSRYL